MQTIARALIATVAASAATRKTIVNTADAPAALGPYSQAIVIDDPENGVGMIYVSGEIGIIPSTGELVEGGIKPETQQLMTTIGNILKAAGATFDDVVECTCLMADLGEYDDFNSVYSTFYSDAPPARAAFQVVALPKGARAEVKCSAIKHGDSTLFLQ